VYESQIAFVWDRVLLHRMLTKIISQPQEDNRRLPRLKVRVGWGRGAIQFCWERGAGLC
jgi:hypothetical protein